MPALGKVGAARSKRCGATKAKVECRNWLKREIPGRLGKLGSYCQVSTLSQLRLDMDIGCIKCIDFRIVARATARAGCMCVAQGSSDV